MAGRFQIEKHTVDESGAEVPGSRRVATPWTSNLITNSGLDNMAGQYFAARCMIGAGNAAPTIEDTQLGSQLAVVTGTVVQGPNSTVEGYNSIVGTYVFGQGVGTGIISELGVAPPTGNITTRALVKDEGGSPTTITKGPMDVLTVTYQIREYPSTSDTVEELVNPHTNVAYTVTGRGWHVEGGARLWSWHQFGPIVVGDATSRPYLDNAPLSAVSANLSSRPSTGRVADVPVLSAYVPGNYFRDIVLTFDESRGNVEGGANKLVVGYASTAPWAIPFFLQSAFDPPIDKDNTKTLIITARKSWGRYEP